jgi:hypothetical protein
MPYGLALCHPLPGFRAATPGSRQGIGRSANLSEERSTRFHSLRSGDREGLVAALDPDVSVRIHESLPRFAVSLIAAYEYEQPAKGS